MKKTKCLTRSSRMKTIRLNNTFNSLKTNTFYNITPPPIQLIPGVTCRGDCFESVSGLPSVLFNIFSVTKYEGSEPDGNLRLIKKDYYRGDVRSSVGPLTLESVFKNIKTLNLSGLIYDTRINITYEDEKDTYYQYKFNSKDDENFFFKIIESQGRHEKLMDDYRVPIESVQKGSFPEGILYKALRNNSTLVTYSIRADYFALQLCSDSTSYAGRVIC
jgi:hypothetical protein